MRIHFGISKFIKPSQLLKWIALLFVGCMAFLGIDQLTAHALEAPIGSYSSYDAVITEAEEVTTYTIEGNNTEKVFRYNIPLNSGASTQVMILRTSTSISCPSGGTIEGSFLWNPTNSNYANLRENLNVTGFSVQGRSIDGSVYYNSFAVSHSFDGADNIFQFTGSLNVPFNGLRLRFYNNYDWTGSYNRYVVRTTGLSVRCYESSADAIIENAEQNTTNIINNQNDNTQDIIDNQTQNTQDIIDNQNQNNQSLIDSQTTCNSRILSYSDTIVSGGLSSLGSINSSSVFGVTDYIPVSKITYNSWYNVNHNLCYYDADYTLISCFSYSNITSGSSGSLTIPENTKFARFSIRNTNVPVFTVLSCKNNSAIINDSITDDNIQGSIENGSNFFGNTTINSHGIGSIVSAPIRLLQAIINSNNSCTNLPLTINMGSSSLTQNVSIPSGCILWDNVPTAVIAVYWSVIFGLFGYYILIDLFHFVDDLHDPDKKNSYVMDL